MDVPDDESVARFIFSKNAFSIRDQRVKPDAFIAAPHQELSVGCIEGLGEPQIWQLGETMVGKLPMARADILAGNVKLAKLYVSRDDQPFRHANILGWLGKSRAEQRDQAITLAFHASLQFRPAAEV